jgi:5'-3' exonuclease
MLALIDGDVIAYHACKSRYNERDPVNMEVNADTGRLRKIPKEFTMEQDADYLCDSWDNYQKQLQSVLDIVYAEDYLMAVKSAVNFRDELYPEYKKNRHKSDPRLANMFVPMLRDMAVQNGLALEAYGMEADDCLRIWATQAAAAGDDFIICSIDKDLKCIPGRHYNLKHNTFSTVSEFEAMKLFYEQLLKGDSSDNIPGLPGIGDVRAAKMLEGCETEDEMQEAIVLGYLAAFPDDWYNHIQINGKLLYLKKTVDDYFTCRPWSIVDIMLAA